ncbi:hypothetical protein VP1G_11022 [Cytospora mali]|uniref:Uncharacterized protein n=1 Tax=Cytospora mali TaxID=578113 RepID=A0A194V3C6_CYTMA|nr:hypothetical protein VP1G_11022 [Valsa mali var. pyri (nom. inval.)]
MAVRGAGHATYSGMAKAAAGVTIDLRGLRGVEVLSVGGRMPTIGVTGFLLGGGISTLSSRFSFRADVVSA